MNKKMSFSSSTVLMILSVIIGLIMIIMTITNIGHVNETKGDITTVENEISSNEKRLASLMLLEEKKGVLEKSKVYLANLIPRTPEEYNVIDYIQNLSRMNKTDFVQIQFEDRKQVNNLNEMPLKLSFEGRYISFIQFLGNLSDGERLIRIDEVTISKVDDTLGVIKADVTACAFFK